MSYIAYLIETEDVSVNLYELFTGFQVFEFVIRILIKKFNRNVESEFIFYVKVEI